MRKLFFANWKMYLSDADAEALARQFLDAALEARVDVAIAPGFTALDRVARVLRGSPVSLGAQNVFWMDGGAYTGEVSPHQLTALGTRYVILGHSERRAYLGETNDMIAKKTKAAMEAGLIPVLCVGETKEEREAGRQEAVVGEQLEIALAGARISPERPLVVAYEPRWAIGTGTPCKPEDVTAMHGHIRSVIDALLDGDALSHVRVLYGGSVDASNAESFLGLPAVDGMLVGGASARPADVRALFDLLSR